MAVSIDRLKNIKELLKHKKREEWASASCLQYYVMGMEDLIRYVEQWDEESVEENKALEMKIEKGNI